jgi:AcrR family transcriptional regulator
MAAGQVAGEGEGPAAVVVSAAVELLEEHGYDGLQLRDVAKRARVSLTTIYRHYPSRDELVVAAVSRWMKEHYLSTVPMRMPGQSLTDALLAMFDHMAATWKDHPAMLEVQVRAALLPAGERLWTESLATFRAAENFAGFDQEFVDDVEKTLIYLTYGLLSAFAVGRIDSDEVREIFQRTARRLTGGV